ncbi:MAG: peptidylprolyl isomerase [Candidatus Zixiibacteriota bacterium]|nr:MAG: peptidylprolyl isomerase [candidate division Zixibacteria bacterium]
MITEQNTAEFNYPVIEADRDYQFTMPQLYDHLYRSPLAPNGGILDVATVTRFLDSLVTDSLAGFEALELNLADYYEHYRVYKQRYNESLHQKYLQVTVYDQVEADSDEVAQFYEERPDLFTADEYVYAYHILVSAYGLKRGPDSLEYMDLPWEQIKEGAKNLIYEIRDSVNSVSDFESLARRYSHDTTSGNRGGLLGWVAPGVYIDPFDSVAFSMEPGQVSEPFEDAHGWHLIFVDDYVPEHVPPLEGEMFESAEEALLTVKANALGRTVMDSLVRDISVEYNDSLMDADVYAVEPQRWLAVVNGIDTIDCYEARGVELNYRNAFDVPKTTTEMKKQMLHSLAVRYTVIQAARNISVDTLPDIAGGEAYLRHKYSKIIVGHRGKDPGWLPPDDMIAEYYQQHVDEFTVEKPMVVQQIIVQDSLLGDFIRSQAMSGVDFTDLIDEFYPGDRKTRAEKADLGPISEEDVPEAVYRAAMLTIEGEASYPVKTQYGYHVVKVLEKRPSLTVDRARPQIVDVLKKRHTDEVFTRFRDELYAKYNVRRVGKLYPVHLKPSIQRN